ncbi:Hypothetical predicted protein [Olea europaea subsp. europaea]|uniref:Uncharacterized protein n=1 Tax=Olea europaea subsp. europaea TaxID=158383 RepID=A0A8S0UG88_OLEEU|nr:Hypothetical predicted protein [Olea europaea subsp. europaea]
MDHLVPENNVAVTDFPAAIPCACRPDPREENADKVLAFFNSSIPDSEGLFAVKAERVTDPGRSSGWRVYLYCTVCGKLPHPTALQADAIATHCKDGNAAYKRIEYYIPQGTKLLTEQNRKRIMLTSHVNIIKITNQEAELLPEGAVLTVPSGRTNGPLKFQINCNAPKVMLWTPVYGTQCRTCRRP